VVEDERERVELTPEVRACVEAASKCYSVCAEPLSYSLDGGGLRDPRHLRLLIDCCEILQTTQNPMLRGSEFSVMLAAVCMEACERVASSCRRLDGSDDQLEACAEACDETADCCRKLAI
jgi:hypothetical protein